MSEEKVTNLETVESEVVNQPTDVESVDVGDNKENKYSTVDEALQHEIYRLMLQAKQDEKIDVCTTDRYNSADFIPAFKDSVYAYRTDIVLCDRLYHKNVCSKSTRKAQTLTDEARKLSDEFVAYTKGIDWTNTSEEYSAKVKETIAEYQERLKAPEMQPQSKDVDVLVYKNDVQGRDFLVTPVNEIPDENLLHTCGVMAKFALAYFLTMRYIFDANFQIKVFPVQSGDYVDIVAQIILQ